MRPSHTPSLRLLQITMAIDALQKYYPDVSKDILIATVRRLVSDILATLGGYQKTYQAVEDAHLTYENSVKDRNKIDAAVRKFLRDLHRALIPIFGEDSAILKEFGFNPTKDPKKPTMAVGAQKVEKANLTRKARHTMGKRQKKAVKGDLPTNKDAQTNNGGNAKQ